MSEITGLDALMRKFSELERRAEKLTTPHNVPLSKLFPDTFMAEHTEFQNLQAMVDESGLFAGIEVEEVKGVFDGEKWSAFVDRRTRFSDWREMLSEAAKKHVAKELFDRLG